MIRLAASVLIAFGLLSAGVAHANPQLAAIPGARDNMELLETRAVQSERFDYTHAVTIASSPSVPTPFCGCLTIR